MHMRQLEVTKYLLFESCHQAIEGHLISLELLMNLGPNLTYNIKKYRVSCPNNILSRPQRCRLAVRGYLSIVPRILF